MAEDIDALPQQREGNYEIARFNALRHGVLSQYTLLPWEDGAEYRALLEALAAEHKPEGPTEEHLVEEVAGVIWRKRRLRLGERAAHHRGLQRAVGPFHETATAALIHIAEDVDEASVSGAITATEQETAAADSGSRKRSGDDGGSVAVAAGQVRFCVHARDGCFT